MTSACKVAFITGAGSGMGRLAARNLAAQGALVAALDRNADGLAETARGLPGIRTFAIDVTDANAVHTTVASVETGLGPIDRVYNCAAIMPYKKLLEQDVQIQHKIMQINYGGLVNVAHAALPLMLARRRGDFISFASMAGVIPTLMTGAYSASKAAVVTYTEILYHENRDQGVRFACVCPPAVDTPLLEQGREAWPKALDNAGPALDPQDVLNAVERSLARGEFLVFPGRSNRISYGMRRFFPNLVWKTIHKMEGF